MSRYILSLDNGGTYIKAVIYDLSGEQIGSAKKLNMVKMPEPGYSEYDQDELWEINSECIREALRISAVDPADIICVGISAQGCGLYAVDSNGNSIRNAITSADIRAQDIVDRWEKDGTNERVYNRTYRIVTSGQPNAILAWLKENESDNYFRIHRIFSMKDYLIYRLTGEIVGGRGCVSASCLLNFNTGELDRELAKAFGIEEAVDKFGPLYWDGEICAHVSKEASEKCGLVVGTPVCAGSHDVVATSIAMGVVDSSMCFMIAGTHGINGYVSDRLISDGTIKYNEYFAYPGKYLVEEAYPASSASLEWVIRAMFGENASDSELYMQINDMVSSVKPNEELPFFLPYLQGNRDNSYACGSWDGLRLTHSRADMLFAVYEGVTFAHRIQLDCLLMNRERPQRIRLAGGVVNSPLWVQMFADVIGIEIEVVSGEEMGALGAAVTAAYAVGAYPDLDTAVENMTKSGEVIVPRKEYKEIYSRRYAQFRLLYEKGNELWRKKL